MAVEGEADLALAECLVGQFGRRRGIEILPV